MMGALLSILTPTAVSGILGFLAKLITWKASQEMEHRKMTDLITRSGFDYKGYAELQRGNDSADPLARWSRVFIVIFFTLTWCFVIIYLLVAHPSIQMDVMVPVNTPWFMKIFGITQKADSKVMEMSAYSLLWGFKSMYEFLMVYHFVKMGK